MGRKEIAHILVLRIIKFITVGKKEIAHILVLRIIKLIAFCCTKNEWVCCLDSLSCFVLNILHYNDRCLYVHLYILNIHCHIT